MQNELLLIPDKPDLERDALAKSWEVAGGEVMRIGKFWIKPDVGNKRVSIYGYDSFCLVLAQILGVEMEMVKDEWIAELPLDYLKRRILIKPISQLEEIEFPKFIKPVTPKLFKAEVFNTTKELKTKIEGIDEKEALICSDPILVSKEVRSFILNREIKDLAYYEGSGTLDAPRKFIEDFLANSKLELPRTFVLDVGFNEKDGWFVIEFNSSWGAGLNFCEPNKVMECIREAARN
jgi:hypothetical protein